MSENKSEFLFSEALKKSTKLISALKVQSTPLGFYFNPKLTRQLYPNFLSFAYGRTKAALKHLDEGDFIDAAISTRTVLDASARAWGCCITIVDAMAEYDQMFGKFFLFEMRRNKQKISDLAVKNSDARMAAILKTLADFDARFAEPLSAKDMQDVSKFFEFHNQVRICSDALEKFGINLPKDENLISYNFLSSISHAGGIAIMASEKAINPQNNLEERINVSNCASILGILISTWYHTALISNACLFDRQIDNTTNYREVVEIRDLLNRISNSFHIGLFQSLK